jgi:hypothetical protein
LFLLCSMTDQPANRHGVEKKLAAKAARRRCGSRAPLPAEYWESALKSPRGQTKNRKPAVNGGFSIFYASRTESTSGSQNRSELHQRALDCNSELSNLPRSLPRDRHRSELTNILFLAAFNSERWFRAFRAGSSERPARAAQQIPAALLHGVWPCSRRHDRDLSVGPQLLVAASVAPTKIRDSQS